MSSRAAKKLRAGAPRITRNAEGGGVGPHQHADASTPLAAPHHHPPGQRKSKEVRELEKLAGAINFVIREPRKRGLSTAVKELLAEEDEPVRKKRKTRLKGAGVEVLLDTTATEGAGRPAQAAAGKRKFEAAIHENTSPAPEEQNDTQPKQLHASDHTVKVQPQTTVCISTFLQDDVLSAIMPSIEVLKKRRTSPTASTPTAALVNGVRKTEPPMHSKIAAHRSPGPHRKSLPRKEKDGEPRNIDSVIFGDITFKAWYPSWYPKEIIGEKDGKDGDLVSALYVCNKCFKYSKEVVPWYNHVKQCTGGLEEEGLAKEVYRFGVGGWEQGENAEWSIWEVDGDEQTLFCQNLSLFAKLFLDNKSVFFDVSGFNYFLLVHTSPPSTPSAPPARQIIGFFSKEKMSWDNNNLACILIFPPWQRKGLGALLISISYAVARREGIMGGPEKPISELGMKGYKRFWGGEVARWLLKYEIKPRGKGEPVTVERISRETWISPEDCLMVMREMGVVERVPEVGLRGWEKEGEGGEAAEGRVRVDKQRVREWVGRNKIDLHRLVCDEGFVSGYALPEDEEEGVDDEGEGEEEIEEEG